MMPSTKKPRGDYEVGYGKPPKACQFRKGQSGNPKGRPKKKRSGPTDVSEVLSEPVNARVGDRVQEMHPFEAGVRRLARRAVDGDFRAILAFVKLCEEYEVFAAPEVDSGGGVIWGPSGDDFHPWLESVTEPIPDDEQ